MSSMWGARSRSSTSWNSNQGLKMWSADGDPGSGSWGASVEMKRKEGEERRTSLERARNENERKTEKGRTNDGESYRKISEIPFLREDKASPDSGPYSNTYERAKGRRRRCVQHGSRGGAREVHSVEREAEVRARPHVWCELNRPNAGGKSRADDLSTGPCLGCRGSAHAGRRRSHGPAEVRRRDRARSTEARLRGQGSKNADDTKDRHLAECQWEIQGDARAGWRYKSESEGAHVRHAVEQKCGMWTPSVGVCIGRQVGNSKRPCCD
ncbi:hypothetical protein B0H13DRAFT_2277487 [Mycena leptocephala]|nr:hypothetical protein B0H13DRAFT_2277487 [Mycena leptocephala]